MLNIFLKSIIKRKVSLLLITVFLSSFPTGTTSLAFCLDEQENHVVGQNLYLVNCHSTDETARFFDENFSVLAEKRKNDCTDGSLSSVNIFNRPPRRSLPISAEVVLSFGPLSERVNYKQQVAEFSLSALSQLLFILPYINAHRTVVLLI